MFGALAVLGLVAACSSSGEGERCQLDNGNDDCASGLVCTRSTDLPLPSGYQGKVPDREGRCCPSDRSTATVAECAQTPQAPGGDAAIPVEAGGDAQADTGTDAGSDSATSDASDGGGTDDGGTDATTTDSGPADASDAG
ncbi:MAG: hypothetical protein U0235_22840 [Polyangiaceae bacterium]